LKIFIFLLAVLFGVWLWRRNRLNALKDKQQDKPHHAASQGNGNTNTNTTAKAAVQESSAMHACEHCGVHVPESDMVKGRAGRYCSESHRQAAGDPLA
jgi:uncharacterized protein